MKGLPSGYNKDLQEDKEAVFDAEHTLAVSVTAAHAVISRLSLNAERTERAASGLLLATDVADYLVSRGVPFRRAHEVVGAMVRRLLAEGRDFSDLTMTEWRDGERDVRRGRAARGHRPGVGAGAPHAAIHESRRRAGRVAGSAGSGSRPPIPRRLHSGLPPPFTPFGQARGAPSIVEGHDPA